MSLQSWSTTNSAIALLVDYVTKGMPRGAYMRSHGRQQNFVEHTRSLKHHSLTRARLGLAYHGWSTSDGPTNLVIGYG
jgi:hypothetical protein